MFVSSCTHMCCGSLSYARAELKYLGLFSPQTQYHWDCWVASRIARATLEHSQEQLLLLMPRVDPSPAAVSLTCGTLCYASNIWQLLCLHIGDIFIPALQLEVIFISHKLHHRVFTSSRYQGEPRSHLVAVTLPLLQASCAFSWDPAISNLVFQAFAMSKFFQRVPACILPRHFQGWVGKFLCSCYCRDSVYHGLGMETVGIWFYFLGHLHERSLRQPSYCSDPQVLRQWVRLLAKSL